MPTNGMEKTIQVEDSFLADMDFYKSNQLITKRVIAVAGDNISISKGKILLNGNVLFEDNPNIIFEKGHYVDFANTVIPKSHFFCIGDNRPGSLDSRMFGPVSIYSIKGKPLYIYLSNTFNRIGSYLY